MVLPTPEEHHSSAKALAAQQWLRESIERDRQSAYAVAHYQRAQRDELTTRIRFGSLALNGASAVAIFGLAGNAALVRELGFTPQITATALSLFVVGAVSAGISLLVHQNHLVRLAGSAIARARTLDTAAGAAATDIGSEPYAALPASMKRAAELELVDTSFSRGAIILQNLSTGCWLGGALTPVLHLYGPSIHAWWAAMNS